MEAANFLLHYSSSFQDCGSPTLFESGTGFMDQRCGSQALPNLHSLAQDSRLQVLHSTRDEAKAYGWQVAVMLVVSHVKNIQ